LSSKPSPALKPSWSLEHIALPLARVFFGTLMLLLGPLRVRGKDRVPRKGPLLILANHISDVDPIATYLACPRFIHFMAKSELFSMPLVGAVLRISRTFPVRRGEPDRESIRHAVELLKSGQVVCIYPEGQLSKNGELLPLQPGVALIARLAKAPVICVRLEGTQRIMPYGMTIPRPAFGGVSATWSEVRQFKDYVDLIPWAESFLQPAVR
jgi:1-acyl-sn-glycerol-3-phosphate acyltransferase